MDSSSSNILSNETVSSLSRNHVRLLPDYLVTIYNIYYPTIMCIGVFGNMMIILVILKMKNMRSSTNIFLANLAIADIMVLVVLGTEKLVDVNLKRGILSSGEKMCNVMYFIWDAVPNTSTLTILAISLERYYAVCKPLEARYISTRKKAYRICLLTWPFAALFSSPHLFIGYQTQELNLGSYSSTICQRPADSFWAAVYYTTNTSLLYFLPLIILKAFYILIARRLKKSVAQNVNIAAFRHRHHVVRVLASVIMTFFVCHLPIRVMFLLYYFEPSYFIRKIGIKVNKIIWFNAFNMLYLHSIANPILYNLMSRRFTAASKNVCSDMIC